MIFLTWIKPSLGDGGEPEPTLAELVLTPHCSTASKVVVVTTGTVRLAPTTTVLTLGVSE